VSRLYRRNRDLSRPIERVEVTAEKGDEGRFDRLLSRLFPWRSRVEAQQMIEAGQARLNGERRKPSTRVRAGDRVVVHIERDEDEAAAVPPPEISVLFEDEWLMALDKPSGAVVHPVGVHQHGTLIQELHRRWTGGPLPKLAHRLDQFTSGVLLVAKHDRVRRVFSAMLERGDVRKTYDALVLGAPTFDERDVDAPIGAVPGSRILMRVDPGPEGKPARSRFRTVRRFRFAGHVSVRIETGRTHQIRVHAAHLGHPLLGDHLYGDGLALPGFERFVLHARATAFRHPITDERLEIEAPLPPPFLAALRALESSGEAGEAGEAGETSAAL
jgi:23S rRNA pseudouridine1911/1915/1917 synthase